MTLGERAGGFIDAMIPVAAAAVDAGAQYGMAVVRFPEGVGWADLCKSPREGYKLLSNFKDGKFNEMAAIKQAGLQGPAVANLALQGAAVVVGQAYMAQINEQLAVLGDLKNRVRLFQEDERRGNYRENAKVAICRGAGCGRLPAPGDHGVDVHAVRQRFLHRSNRS